MSTEAALFFAGLENGLKISQKDLNAQKKMTVLIHFDSKFLKEEAAANKIK